MKLSPRGFPFFNKIMVFRDLRIWKRDPVSGQRGAALLIVLGMVAVLAVVVVAFTARSSRDLSSSRLLSSHVVAEDVVSTATEILMEDFKREILAGSVQRVNAANTPLPGYYPASVHAAVPDRSTLPGANGKEAAPPNLVKQSSRGADFYNASKNVAGQMVYPSASAYPPRKGASDISTTTGPAGVSPERWNKPLLLPRAQPESETDRSPATQGVIPLLGGKNLSWTWTPPDWFYMRQDGSLSAEQSNSGSTPVVARFAYQVYDIGGLLDLNVAGYDPEVTGDGLAGLRGSPGLANLRELGFSPDALKSLLKFRNPATLVEKDDFPHRNRYLNFLFSSSLNHGFLRAAGATNTQDAVATNRGFASRGSLISFVEQLSADKAEKRALMDALQSLTHYSRALEQPSFQPGFRDPKSPNGVWRTVRPSIVPPAGRIDDRLYDSAVIQRGAARDDGRTDGAGLPANDWRAVLNMPYEMALGNNRGGNDAWGTMEERAAASGDKRALQDVINPAFLDVRVVNGFVRFDGTRAEPGEPLVKKRFPLDRLSWITFQGPSADQAPNSPSYNAAGTAQAIYQCFGLKWSTDPITKANFWAYDHGKTGGIMRLEELLAEDTGRGLPREPDFFELLKASIGVGSLGKTSSPTHFAGNSADPATFQQVRDRSSTLQILEIAANILDQADRDSFPTVLRIPNPSPNTSLGNTPYSPPLFAVSGVEDLPYFYRMHFRGIQNAKDAAFPAAEAPVEISDSIREFADPRRGFRCGTTSILAFPELWNPHAKTQTPYNGPVSFRVVAAHETPRFLGDPSLQVAPKQGSLTQRDVSNDPMMQMVRGGDRAFVAQPGGLFAYRSDIEKYPNEINHWLRIVNMDTRTQARSSSPTIKYNRPMQLWNPVAMIFEWPYRIGNSGLSMDERAKVDRRTSTLFWDLPAASSPAYGGYNSNPIIVARIKRGMRDDGWLQNTTVCAPLWKLPEFENGQYPWMKPPVGWPLNMQDCDFTGLGRLPQPLQLAPFLKWGPNRVDMGETGLGYWYHRVDRALPAMPDIKLLQLRPGSPGGRFRDLDVVNSIRLGLSADQWERSGWLPIPRTDYDPVRRIWLKASVWKQPPYVSGVRVVPERYDGTPWPQDRWFYGVNRSPAPGLPPQLELWRCLRARGPDEFVNNLGPEEFDIDDPTLPGLPRMGPARYPQTFDPHKTFFVNSFHAGYGSLKYQLDGKPVEFPYPMYRAWSFAMTSQDGVQRAILQSDPLRRSPSGEGDWREGVPGTAPKQLGDWHKNWVVDMRGTELRFSLGNLDLFREPATLCRLGLPAGSSLSAGPSNFLSGELYGGSVQDKNGQRWVGFSLGEVPSQIVVVTKAVQMPQTGITFDVGSGKTRETLWNWAPELYDTRKSWRWPDGNEAYYAYPAQDIPTDVFGRSQDVIPRMEAKYMARFFIVPTNVVHLDEMFMTVRLEYQQPGTGAWIPYDERYMAVSGADSNREAAVPVDRFGELELKLSEPSNILKRYERYVQNENGKVDWRQTGRPIGWGSPVITSYDPRTSRFGNPWRSGSPDRRSIYGSTSTERQFLNPPPDGKDIGPDLSLYPYGGAPTDRPGGVFLDNPTSTNPPATLTPNFMVPGHFNYELIKPEHGFSLNSLFGLWARNHPFRQWWACARLDGKYLYQYPSANSYDVGWFPRLHGPGYPDMQGFTPNYRQVTRGGSVPNFFQRSFLGLNYADSLRVGSLSENIAPSPVTPEDPFAPYRQAYADPDDVVRRAQGAFAVRNGYSSRFEGLPLSQPKGGPEDRQANRPIILNRPFQSVAELGYVFRGTPWKNLGFSTPESADAALLDVFCISEPPPVPDASTQAARKQASTQGKLKQTVESAPPLVAGKFNLNTRQEPVLRALMTGVIKDAQGKQVVVDKDEASKAAKALITRTTGYEQWNGPLSNVSELVGKMLGKDLPDGSFTEDTPVYTSKVPRTVTEPNRNPDMGPGRAWLTWHFTGYSADLDSRVFPDARDWKVQRRREAILRALVDSGQTRVWNLMFDIIVQTGSLPPGVASLARFNKATECRAWVCVSIDRLTGEVLDHQVEWVAE